jgi:hypothetical protein
VLLGWLLTGDSHLKTLMPKIQHPRMRRIVEACTDFAPERRYASAQKAKTDLRNADGHRQKRALRLAFSRLRGMPCIGICHRTLHRLYAAFSVRPAFRLRTAHRAAVRLVLDKTEDEPIDEREC